MEVHERQRSRRHTRLTALTLLILVGGMFVFLLVSGRIAIGRTSYERAVAVPARAVDDARTISTIPHVAGVASTDSALAAELATLQDTLATLSSILSTVGNLNAASAAATNPTVIREAVRTVGGGSIDTSQFVTRSLFDAQVNGTNHSIESLHEGIQTSVSTGALTVSGDTALSGALTAATTTLSALTVAGTTTFQDALAFTSLAGGILTTDANGLVSTTTIGAASIVGDSLDFAQFKDALIVDVTTSFDLDTNGADLNFDNASLFVDSSADRVGIGTTTPAAALDVAGNIMASTYSIAGDTILRHPITPTPDHVSDSNIALGSAALESLVPISSTEYLTAVGVSALQEAIDLDHITAVGAYACQNLTTGAAGNNTCIGIDAMRHIASGTLNVMVGEHAGTFGSALDGMGTVAGGTYVGYNAGQYAGGTRNVALGYSALAGLSSSAPVTGNFNTAIGGLALSKLQTTSQRNTALGHGALQNLAVANDNTAVGYAAGNGLLTGARNTLLGYQAGSALTVGGYNIAIGQNVGLPMATGSQQLNIGNIIFGTGIYNGTTASAAPVAGGMIGIGTTTPGQTLVVAGTIQSTNLLGGATNLTTDASGNIIRDPSDVRLKTNIADIYDALDKLLALRGVSYEWKDKSRFGSQTEIGFIAQEVDPILPQVVRKGGGYWSINTRNILAVVVEGFKDFYTEFLALRDTVRGFAQSFTSERVTAGELCVDDICVTRNEFAAMVAASGDDPVPPIIPPHNKADAMPEPDETNTWPNATAHPDDEGTLATPDGTDNDHGPSATSTPVDKQPGPESEPEPVSLEEGPSIKTPDEPEQTDNAFGAEEEIELWPEDRD